MTRSNAVVCRAMNPKSRAQNCACGRAASRGSWFGLSLGLSTLLFAPKCPLCLAAYFAIGSAAVPLFNVMRPAAFVLVLCSVVGVAFTWLRMRRLRVSESPR
jgi:hypothetical protein